MRTQSILFLALAPFGIGSTLSAGPVSACVNHVGDSGFTCNIFETLADGTPSEISNIFAFPAAQSVVSGYIVLLETPSSSQTDPTQWSDVLHFIDNGSGQATSGQLLSSGCNCFPTSLQVNATAHAFIVEAQTGTGNDFLDSTAFVAGFNTFNIFSAAPVSEPASIGLMASALLVAFIRIRHQGVR
jgi:hypothetical protein